MRIFFCIFLLFPTLAFAMIAGISDRDIDNVPPEVLANLDKAFTGYYLAPSADKVEQVLDIINDSEVLRTKTSWPPMVGFLSIVFADNKDKVFAWISRNDYNSHAGDVFISALLHAKLKESALVFAQAHGWDDAKMQKLREYEDKVDLKRQQIILPGHIDTLWGAFFASGEEIYVDQIISVLFFENMPYLEENKKLAHSTLLLYAKDNKPVRSAIEKRVHLEKDAGRKAILQGLLPIT